MLLIADSGSTKTDWAAVIENEKTNLFYTDGLNPYFKSHAEIVGEVKNVLIPQIPENTEVGNLFFYGAGCSDKAKCNMIKTALLQCFPAALIVVEHDILGAARATCGNAEGIVCILGTGSNSCLYDGKKIINKIGGLGYILGDEGSGAHLGKTFLSAYLNRELPNDLQKAFASVCSLTQAEIEQQVYEKPLANRFLASFSKFIGSHKQHFFVKQMVEICFDAFLTKHVCRYSGFSSKPVHFVGSVAYYYSDILKQVAAKRKINTGKILLHPAEELALYHSSRK